MKIVIDPDSDEILPATMFEILSVGITLSLPVATFIVAKFSLESRSGPTEYRSDMDPNRLTQNNILK